MWYTNSYRRHLCDMHIDDWDESFLSEFSPEEYYENLKKAKLDLSEFMVMCRQQGYFDLTNIQTAVFEYNGKLTILPVSSQRPVTPNDMNLVPEQELLFTELIMDGRILEDKLKRMGLDLKWLDKQLKQRHITSQDVFLAVCDKNLKFVLYEKNCKQ